MKKIFTNTKSLSISSSSQPNEMINTANYTIGQNYSHFIGKTFQLSKHTVCVDDVIAEGGFSIVFLVKSTVNGKKYALKRMYVNNELDLEVCKREIQIIKSLSEQNKKILKYIDSSIQRQTEDIYEILLLTKYCKLGGLVQLLNDRISNGTNRLQENEIIRIFCDICEALVDCHANGIIHRDLKIENILIDDYEQPTESKRHSQNPRSINYVLCDFGSATMHVYDRRLNNSTQSVTLVADEINRYTTLSYRSPEMVDLYSNKPITTKSDIWALGCLLYKLCYFQMPFGESQLAIQEGRFTIPDAKANYFSKQLNILINFMLEPDPLKRPDIYQVSYLAFQLAQRSYPFKITENVETTNFNNLQMPLTESEWRRNSLANTSGSNPTQQQKSKQIPGEQIASTAVNPRERPKGNLTTNSTILPLSHSPFVANSTPGANSIIIKPRNQSLANTNTNKSINVSIKPPQPPQHVVAPPVQQNQPKIGFDDDFGVLNASTKQPLSPTNQYELNQDVNKQTVEKKSHRRSASHSSTNFFQSTNNIAQLSLDSNGTTTTPQIVIDNRVTPSLLQQQQYQQYQVYLQQQMQVQQQSPQISVLNNNRLLAHVPHHSRSASASPNVVINKNLAAQIAEEAQKKVGNSIPTNETNQLSINTKINENPFNKQNQNPNPNNPFGDSFSQLNDNDIFGLEFDWIRQNNSSLSNQDLNSKSMNETKRTEPKIEKYNKKTKNQKEVDSIIGKLTNRSRISNSNELISTSAAERELPSPNMEDQSSSSSDQSSTCVESIENKNSKSSQYSSSTTIVSVDSSAFSTDSINKQKNKCKKVLNSTRITTDDPFRNAPFKIIQPTIDLNSSSSNSSTSPISNDKLNKLIDDKLNLSDESLAKINLNPVNPSAFQPYKRPPDPFVSAPFDHVAPYNLKTSPTSSVTPTSSSISSSKSKTKQDNSLRKRSTTVNYRSSDNDSNKSVNMRTPASKKVPNPFINAPFTGKKVKPVQSLSSHTIKASSSTNVQISTSNSLNSIDESQITPTVSNYSSMDSNATPVAQFLPSSFQRQLDISDNVPSVIKISQSHSLNEIKETESVQPSKAQFEFEPVVDTLKLQFKKRALINQQDAPLSRVINSKTADNIVITNDKSIIVKKIPLTKSCSANATILNENTKSNSSRKPPGSGGSSTASGGGISNMSFDDY